MSRAMIIQYVEKCRKIYGSDKIWRLWLPDRFEQYIDFILAKEGGKTINNTEIAKIWNVSPERVRQIQGKTLDFLQRLISLRDFFASLANDPDLENIMEHLRSCSDKVE